MIERKLYLDQLIAKKDNGLIKVITGIRRCGKSYLLFEIYHQYLKSTGVDDDHIIELALDDDENIRYRNPIELGKYIREIISKSNETYYIFIDEIQKVKTIKNPYLEDESETVSFVDVLLGLMKKKNADVYVTCSNSKMLSSDILTEFRGRGDEIRVHPLSFSEFYGAYKGDKRDAWQEYFTYGGMPFVASLPDHRAKAKYLSDIFDKIYISDILERHKIGNKAILDDILNVISSSVGSLTNPTRMADTFASVNGEKISADSISRYLDYFIDAFMIYKAQRYDIKGRKYIGSPLKYYYSDIGLRNARLNFRQTEENHIMENIIYNELLRRGYSVDVGVVTDRTGGANVQKEIDFVVNDADKKIYIQSAFQMDTDKKESSELASLILTKDFFKKIIVRMDIPHNFYDDNGIFHCNLIDFLLNRVELF